MAREFEELDTVVRMYYIRLEKNILNKHYMWYSRSADGAIYGSVD